MADLIDNREDPGMYVAEMDEEYQIATSNSTADQIAPTFEGNEALFMENGAGTFNQANWDGELSSESLQQQTKKSAFEIIGIETKLESANKTNDGDADSLDELEESQAEFNHDSADGDYFVVDPTEGFQPDVDYEGGLPSTVSEVLAKQSRPGERGSAVSADTSASRFRVVKTQKPNTYSRGTWKCVDFYEEEKAELPSASASIAAATVSARGTESGGSSRASSVHYMPGQDDPTKNPVGTVQPAAHAPVGQTQPSHGGGGAMGHIVERTEAPSGPVGGPSASASLVESGPSIQAGEGHSSSVPSVSAHASAPAPGSMDTSEGSHSEPNISTNHMQTAAPVASSDGSLVQQGPSQPAGSVAPSSLLPSTGDGFGGAGAQGAGGQGVGDVVTQGAGVGAERSSSPVSASGQMTAGDGGGQPGDASRSDELSSSLSGPLTSTEEPITVIVQRTGDSGDESVSSDDSSQQAIPSSPLDGPTSKLAEKLDRLKPDEEKEEDAGSGSADIDNKIEQAMDLVKSHLMYAVREEVDDLKQEIDSLRERNSRLEYENSVLKSYAPVEVLAQLRASSGGSTGSQGGGAGTGPTAGSQDHPPAQQPGVGGNHST